MRGREDNKFKSQKKKSDMWSLKNEKKRLYCWCFIYPQNRKCYFQANQGKIYSLTNCSPSTKKWVAGMGSVAPKFNLLFVATPPPLFKPCKSCIWPSLTPSGRVLVMDLFVIGHTAEHQDHWWWEVVST